jgi:hypothetical protein
MSTRSLNEGKGGTAHKANILSAIYGANYLENVRASTSHNPVGLHGLLRGYLYIFHQVLNVLIDLRQTLMTSLSITGPIRTDIFI